MKWLFTILVALTAHGQVILDPWTLFPGGASSTLTNGLVFAYRMDESSGNLAPAWGSITMTNVGTMGFNTSGGVISGAVSNSTYAASGRYFWSAAKWYTGTITSLSIGFWCFSTNTVASSTDGDMWGPSQYNSSVPGGSTNVQFYTSLRTALPGSARRAEVAVTDRNVTTARKIYRSTNALPANQWNLIVMTFTNNTLKLYTNGVEVTGAQLNKDQDNTVTTIGPVPDNASTIGTIQVTATGGAGAHNGKGALDMAFGYDRVLTDAEVAELWNSGAGKDPSNP